MISALGSHRFNPQTGLWELVTLENVSGVEVSPPAVAEVAAIEVAPGLVADGPVTLPPEPVTPLPSDDGGVPDGFRPPTGLAATVIELWVNSRTGEQFYAGSTHWTNDDPDWVNMGAAFGTPPLWDDAGIVPPGEPADPDFLPISLPVEPIYDVLPGEPCDPAVVFPPPFANRGLMVINGIYHGSYTFDRNDLGEDWWAAEQLNGGLGRDVLIGDDLSNDLNGGAGADVMIGGGGQDIYWVDDAGDVVIEYGNGGRDVVISSASYTLSAHVEKLVLAWGAGDINGTGNDLDNILVGNEGKNVLSGGPGNDFLYGGGGGDTLIGGEGQDVFTFGGPVSLDVVVNVILDFEVGVDKIANMTYWPLGIDEDRASALPCMWQEGTDTILAAPWGLEIRLVGIDMRLLSQDDFVFTQQLFIPV